MDATLANVKGSPSCPQETEVESYPIGGIKQDVQKGHLSNSNYNESIRRHEWFRSFIHSAIICGMGQRPMGHNCFR